jgi:anaerobic selenocysteine-containing dehydrogenase
VSVDSHPKLYRGRIAPSPTGLLHLGHARTFWIAAQRAAERSGTLILRNEDLDPQRCRPELVEAMLEDLHWLGIEWTEGPNCGGTFGPYAQSERRIHYLAAWKILRDRGFIYPCTCSRKDVSQAAGAPNEGDDEPMYPGTCRPKTAELRSAGQPLRRASLAQGRLEAAVPTCAEDGVEPFLPFAEGNFRTPSGKALLYNEALKAQGLDPVAEFIPPAESRHSVRARTLPLELLARKSDNFLNTTFSNVPAVQEMEDTGFLDICAADALARGIGDGDRVRVFNQRGEVLLKARVDGKVQPGVVSARLNWVRTTPGFQSINSLTSEKLTDMGNSATFYSVLVEVELAKPKVSG